MVLALHGSSLRHRKTVIETHYKKATISNEYNSVFPTGSLLLHLQMTAGGQFHKLFIKSCKTTATAGPGHGHIAVQ